MLDFESMMRSSVEPIQVRKRPGFWKRLLSWILPIHTFSVKGETGVMLKVMAWRGKYLLDTAKVNYSFGSLHDVMQGSIRAMVDMGVRTDRVLMLGYGGGSAAEIIHQDYSRDAEIIGVEIDSQVLEVAKQFFYTQGVRLLHEDAIEYVQKAAKNAWQYDLVVCDLFIDGKVAQGITTDLFVESLSKIVVYGGGVLINTMMLSVSANDMENLLKSVFTSVKRWNEVKGNSVFLCKMGGNA